MTSEPSAPSPIVFFHEDAFDFSNRLMGRQSAGSGFLRAVVAARGDRPVVGYGDPASERGFQASVRAIDPSAVTEWISRGSPGENLERVGTLFRGEPNLAGEARWRLRVGPGRYSLTGVTHTLSTSAALGSIAELLHEPVQPWDALVCTSQAALSVVKNVFEAEAEYLRWRLGDGVRISGPELPVIPLGVHAAEFQFSQAQRRTARARAGLAEDEIVLLYAGRLNFHGKAHPYALFRGAEAAALATGAKLCIMFFGRAPRDEIQSLIAKAAASHAPSVRTIFLDGASVPPAEAWACGDIFVSLADALQETFGLTPVEAMAAGLPCVVTDWNGYKDTVRDGVDGFRIPTAMPKDAGAVLAASYEAGRLNLDHYSWATTSAVAVDIEAVADRIAGLATNEDLRRRMGAAGKARANSAYDWRVVYQQYQALWAELKLRRDGSAEDRQAQLHLARAPKASATYLDPFALFNHYATFPIEPGSRLEPAPGASEALLAQLSDDPLFRRLSVGAAVLESLLRSVLAGATSVADAAASAKHHPAVALRAIGVLAKMGLVRVEAGER